MRVLWVLFAALVPGHVQDLSASGVHLSSRSLNLWPSACFYFISVGMAIKVSTFSPEYQPRAFKRDVGIMESGSSGEDEATRMRDRGGGERMMKDEGQGEAERDYWWWEKCESLAGLTFNFKVLIWQLCWLGIDCTAHVGSGLTSATGRLQMEVFDLLTKRTHLSPVFIFFRLW